MRCQRAQQRLMAYHDGELSPGMARRLAKHLESCPECSQLLERLRRADDHVSRSDGVNQMVGVAEVPSPGDRYWESFTARVLDRVEEDAATRAPDRSRPRRGWNLFIPRMAPAFSIALVIVVAAGVLMKMGRPVSVPEKPEAALKPMVEKVGGGLDETQGEDRSVKEESGELADARGEEMSSGTTREVSSKTSEAQQAAPEPEPVPVADRTGKDLDPSLKKGSLALPEVDGAFQENGSSGVPEPPRPDSPAAVETAVSSVVPGAPEAEPEAREVLTVPPSERDKGEQVQVEKTPVKEPVARVEGKRDDSPVAGKPLAPPEEASGTIPAVSSAPPVASGETVDDLTVENTVGAPATAEQTVSSEFAVESEQPGEQGRETGTAAKPPQTEIRALAEPTPSTTVDAVSTTVSESRLSAFNSLYRGPRDQLTHARNLAEVRKFWESEQVLKDLLSQSPPSPIQEEASLLLVKVLNSQNRAAEAQKALDSAKEQFPASEMIQTYELGLNGDKPIP